MQTIESTTFTFKDGGLPCEVKVTQQEMENVLMPVVTSLTRRYLEKPKSRLIAFFAGPPGGGKTTIVHLCGEILTEEFKDIPHQILPVDGFHFTNEELFGKYRWSAIDDTLFTSDKAKGNPDSFDVERIKTSLQLLKEGNPLTWPIYDRFKHNPVEGTEVNPNGIMLVDGAYNLLTIPPWDQLQKYADYKVWVETPEIDCKRRIIERGIKTGRREEELLYKYAHFTRTGIFLANTYKPPQEELDAIISANGERKLLMLEGVFYPDKSENETIIFEREPILA